MPNLTSLALSDIPNLTDVVLQSIVQTHANLINLAIGYGSITSKGLGRALRGSRVMNLDVYECVGVNSLEGILYDPSASTGFVEPLQLKRVRVEWCRYLGFENTEGARCLAPGLENLTVARCGSVGKRDVEAVCRVLPSLKVVEVVCKTVGWKARVKCGNIVWKQT